MPIRHMFCALLLASLVGAAEKTTVIQDFEQPFDVVKWPGDAPGEVAFSSEWKADGKQSLRIDPGLMTAIETMSLKNWSGYTHLRLRFRNPGQATTVGFELVDHNGSFHERHQNGFGIQPGESTIEMGFSGGLWRGEENRPYRGKIKTPIDISRISRFSLTNSGSTPIWVDQIEVVAVPPITCPGGFAFDFGKAGVQVMNQYIGIDQNRRYAADPGYGLLGGHQGPLLAAMSFPTPMLGDGFALPAEGFQVDLPGGKYLGLIAFERGGFWEGEYCGYKTMRLKVGGTVASSHEFSPAGAYFHFQDAEVSDPARIVDELIWPAHAVSEFSFTAAKGGNVFTVETDGATGLPLRVAGLVVAPDNAEGKRFVHEHIALQRKTIATVFAAKETGQRGAGRAAPGKDLQWQPMTAGAQASPRDWPLQETAKLPELYGIPGQRLALQIAVYARKAGTLAVGGGALAGAGSLPAPQVSYGCYLPNRPFGTGTVWLEIHHFRPEASCSIGPDLARALLVEYDIPEGAKPGAYTGAVTLKLGGASVEVPIAVTVVAAKLPALPIPVGMFMNALPVSPQELGDDAMWWRLQESLLREQTRAGLTAVSGGPGLELNPNGAKLDGDAAKRYLKLAKSLGVQAAIAYGGFLPGKHWNGDWNAMAAGIKETEAECGVPLYNTMYDEPGTPEEKNKVIAKLQAATKAGVRTIGYTSAHWGDNLWEQIVGNSYAPALNLHTVADFAKIKGLGAHAWVYNNGSDRFTFSVFLWQQMKLGCEGRMEWIGSFVQGFAFHNLDGREPEPGKFFVHNRLGTLPTPGWISAREGLLDTRIRLALEAMAPAGDPALKAWSDEGYRDGSTWPVERLNAARAAMLTRLAKGK